MQPIVLVIDDDHHLVQLLKTNFENEGYHVLVGYDGHMAIVLARARKPQLIVMDVNMPMTNGLKALEFLRKNEDTKHIPVIFLTGADSRVVYPVVEANHRAAYLKKPVDLDELNSFVREFMQKYGNSSPA